MALTSEPNQAISGPESKVSPRDSQKWAQVVRTLLNYWPVGLVFVITAPRLVNPEFGLFDDPAALREAQNISQGDWSVLVNDAAAGRFRPVYWLQYAFLYRLFGRSAGWFFLWNELVLCALTAGLLRLTRKLGGSREIAWLAAGLFVLSGPVVENAYTLLKPELLQGGWIVGALLAVTSNSVKQTSSARLVLTSASVAVLLLLATMTKETAIVLLPIAAVWLLLSRVRLGRGASGETSSSWVELLLSSAAATLAYFAVRAQFLDVGLTGGTYSNNMEWGLGRFTDSAIRWGGWLLRDFGWLLPVALLALADRQFRRFRPAAAVVGSIVWIGLWIAIYLPWEFTVEYYMLPVALGTSLIGGIVLGTWLTDLRMGRLGQLTGLALLLALLLWLTTLPNNISNARQQIAVDAANGDMLRFLDEHLGPGEGLLVNIQARNEYIDEIQAYLDASEGRKRVQVEVFNPAEGLPTESTWIATPSIRNQPRLSVRMGVVEAAQTTWNSSLLAALGEQARPAYQIERRFHLLIIDLPRVLCPLLPVRGYCLDQRPFIDTREFAYGWSVYRWPGLNDG